MLGNLRSHHLFQYLINEWKFQPYLLKELNQDNTRKEACLIDFHVSFKFHSILYATLSEVFMEKVFRKMVGAFTDRAQVLYGKPCTLPIKIKN
jgi:ribosome-associated toxin RatA of RatAB toxin-antitoxin module